jgi:hypothetical protein
MEVPTLTIFCREGHPPADDIFAYWGCPQPVPAQSPRPGPGPAEEARSPAPAGGAARRRDRGGGRGVAVVRRDRAVGRRCGPGGAGRAGRGPRPGGGVHVPACLRPGQPRCARPRPRCLAAHQGGAGRGPAGDRHRRQGRPRREEQGREGPAPGRGAGARHRRGSRPGRRGGEIERDPCSAGPAESIRRSRLRDHHDRRHAHPERHRAGHPQPGRRLRDDRRACFTLLLLSVMACQRVQPGRIRPGYAGLCGVPG